MVIVPTGLLAILVVALVGSPWPEVTADRLVPGLVFVAIIGGLFAVLPLILASYIADARGLTRRGPFGRRTFIAWADIAAVRRSSVARDVVTVVGHAGERIAISKGMPRFDRLVDAIRSRQPTRRRDSARR